MTETATTTAAPARKIGLLLGIGIFLFPILFSWFTLRKGHSRRDRIIAFGWMAVWIAIGVFGPKEPAPTTAPAEAVAAQTPEQIEAARLEREAQEQAEIERGYDRHPETALELTSVRGTKEGFETVLELSGTIANKAPFDIKDPEIDCRLTGPSGTEVGRVRQTLFEIIPTDGSKTFRGLNMGFMGSNQVAQFNCTIRRAARP